MSVGCPGPWVVHTDGDHCGALVVVSSVQSLSHSVGHIMRVTQPVSHNTCHTMRAMQVSQQLLNNADCTTLVKHYPQDGFAQWLHVAV